MEKHGGRIDELAQFYRAGGNGEPDLFQIWETGGARGDSITPSTFSAEYRRWMHDKLVHHLKRNLGGLLSLGCGNAMIEADLVSDGFEVLGVDAMPEAVALASAKGVDALCVDVTTWNPDRRWSTIYMDGVLGHLYDTADGLTGILRRVRSWLTAGDAGAATLVASNDDTRNGAGVQLASGVPGFYWLSAGTIAEHALAAGFDEVETGHFLYRRPQSGDRLRSVVVAHAYGGGGRGDETKR